MRVLMVSKACLLGIYQRKLEEIARFPDVELVVVVPPSWRDGSRLIHLERAHTDGYEMIVQPMAFSGSFHMHFYPFLGRLLRAVSPDVVHVDEEPYNLATFHTLWLARRVGARTLWFTWQNLMRRYPFPFRAIESYSLRHTDHAIAGSEGAATVWREKGYSGPLAVIPQFGVDPRIFAPAPAARRPVDRREYAARGRCRAQAREQQDTDGGFAIGYLGRLVPEKGVDLLVEAVGDMGDGWRLAILGGGPEQPRLETLVDRLGVGDRVTFAGWLPSLELGSFYRGLDVLVLPSRSRPNWVEQFGRVLIEAMACGVPVIGSDCGEIPHVIGDAGLVFPEGDARALRNCLVQLMATPALRADLARRGRERVLARFTQSQVAARTVAVYRELLA